MKAIVDASPPYLFSLGAVLCLVFAFFLAYYDKIKAATLLGALFFLCVTFAYFPQLDSINAIGVNVTLRRNLERAEDILAQLKKLAVLNAKSSYMQIAWGGRWGSPSARDKQAILDAINEQLADLKVSDAEREEIAQPFVQLIGVDLGDIYFQVFERFLTWKEQELASMRDGNVPDTQRLQSFANDRGNWHGLAAAHRFNQKSKPDDLAAYLRAATPTKMLDDKERAIAERFMSDVQSLYDGCRAKRGYTPEAAQFYDKYRGDIDLKVGELFGVEPRSARR